MGELLLSYYALTRLELPNPPRKEATTLN
ncbi:hypothetical protein C5167_029399 [Papaver somniferum]|nr:hypothetical protein C5167_029399 [Papaver somniferum]